jgi:hypothetical protein
MIDVLRRAAAYLMDEVPKPLSKIFSDICAVNLFVAEVGVANIRIISVLEQRHRDRIAPHLVSPEITLGPSCRSLLG